MNTNNRTVLVAKLGLMTAIAYICSLVQFPILPAASFLDFELHDLPVMITAFAFGPFAGLAVGTISLILNDFVFPGMASGPYGLLMHFTADATLALVAGFVYLKFKTKKGAILALVLSGIALTIVMIPANLFITPYFLGTPRAAIIALLPIITLFNLLKSAILGIVVFFIYKRLSPFLRKGL